jgi:hypothetical protein
VNSILWFTCWVRAFPMETQDSSECQSMMHHFVMFDGRMCQKKCPWGTLRIKKTLSDSVSYFCFFHNLFPRHLQTTLCGLKSGQTLRIYWDIQKVLGC